MTEADKKSDAQRHQEEKAAYQKALLAVLSAVRKQYAVSWHDLLNERLGLGVGTDYQKYLSRGLAGSEKTTRIRDWIITHAAALAYDLHPEYFPRSSKTDWDGLIEELGRYGCVQSRPFEAGLLHDISEDHPINARMKLGQEFTIEIESPISGSVIALDRYEDAWYPLPLHANKSLDPMPVQEGLYGFPIRERDFSQIVPMRQRFYKKEHGHCFLIGPHGIIAHYARRFVPKKAIPINQLHDIAKRLSELEPSKIAILLENVLFE